MYGSPTKTLHLQLQQYVRVLTEHPLPTLHNQPYPGVYIAIDVTPVTFPLIYLTQKSWSAGNKSTLLVLNPVVVHPTIVNGCALVDAQA